MRALGVLASVALVFVVGAHAGVPRGTLTGDVRRGPITPVCALEQPCDEPAKHATLVFMRDGQAVGRAVTDAAGHYRLSLPAGVYGVRRPGQASIDRRLEPRSARVRAGRVTSVDFFIDTGIR